MVAKPGTDTIEPTFKLMMIRTNIAPSHDVAHCRLLLIRIALCRDWLRAFHHGNDVCGYIAAVPGGAFGNIITRILKLASSTYERAQCGRRQSVEILPRAGKPACCQRRKLGSGGALGGGSSSPKPDSRDIPLVGTGIAPVAGQDERPADSGKETPSRKGNFQKRTAEAVEHTLQEHPNGSAPPLDRLTQDLDPDKDL